MGGAEPARRAAARRGPGAPLLNQTGTPFFSSHSYPMITPYHIHRTQVRAVSLVCGNITKKIGDYLTTGIRMTTPTENEGNRMFNNFHVCCNCGAVAPRRKRLCNNPDGCGPTSAADRRKGRKSVWRELTTSEIATIQERIRRREALMNELLGDDA